ncbi:hypothetical protein QQF64_033205 [Cirrhinus molitorella]|uniref:Secreted protein n=1 Tax=Cirrhinus molitorella TaxID=172907 RepID=A0ABR3MT71_9TELE
MVQSGQIGVWLCFAQSFSTLDSSSHSTAGEILGAGRGCSPTLLPNYSEKRNRKGDFTDNLSRREIPCPLTAVSDPFSTLARRCTLLLCGVSPLRLGSQTTSVQREFCRVQRLNLDKIRQVTFI